MSKNNICDKLDNCPECGVKLGEMHLDCCDIEHCSICGWQLIGCDCEGHDKAFARWTGIIPGVAEAEYLGTDLNGFYESGAYRYFLVKPQ